MCGNGQASHMNLVTKGNSSFRTIRCHILYNYMPCHCLPDTKTFEIFVFSLGTSLAWFSLTVLPKTGCKAEQLFSSHEKIQEGRRGNEFIALQTSWGKKSVLNQFKINQLRIRQVLPDTVWEVVFLTRSAESRKISKLESYPRCLDATDSKMAI